MRKQAREHAFKLIFEYLFLKTKNVEGLSEQPSQLSDTDKLYIDKVYNGVVENFDSLYAEIAALSEDFKAERIFKVDLAILLLAMYEIKYADDIPDIVSVNEAVELAKVYSTDKSHTFINGILAAYLKAK
ncbi:MAG: transcription antitermination factor NusB [Clostridia bacterium]|nr:transcription antitermination factor NusB [Clostridia bacterium]